MLDFFMFKGEELNMINGAKASASAAIPVPNLSTNGFKAMPAAFAKRGITHCVTAVSTIDNAVSWCSKNATNSSRIKTAKKFLSFPLCSIALKKVRS